ncbi:hypothetical protein [Streptomyces sp. NPDC004042]|uniref:hypothetical protein n=1 Tax=Streptomyces sp. NPDC004042 TaxID=3154451 RepID=UPI0033B37C74
MCTSQRRAASDFDARKQRGVWGYSDLAGRRAGRSGDIGQAREELVQGGPAVIVGQAFVVGQRDGDEHALEIAFGLKDLTLGGALRGGEVALGARHAVLALLEEGAGAVAVAEVVVLPRLTGCGGAGNDRVAVD